MIQTLAALEIPDYHGKSQTFQCIVLKDDESRLTVSFQGTGLHPCSYSYAKPFLEQLRLILPQHTFSSVVFDVTLLAFVDGPGLYVVMDIVDAVQDLVVVTSFICVRHDDEWQHVFAEVLIDNENISMQPTVIDVAI